MPDDPSTLSTLSSLSPSSPAPTWSEAPESLASPGSGAVSTLQRAARGALALTALALPFELGAPLARVGPLQLSSVELVLYVALALSAAAIAVDVLPRLTRLPWREIAQRHAGVALFAIVLLASAARAPLARADAMKFALRNMGGIALYVAAANLLRAPAAALTVALAMGIGAVMAAVTMWCELHVPGAARALAPFHAASFDVFGLPRASGCFQYPNIAAMYLEAALPVTLMASAALDVHRGGGAKRGNVGNVGRAAGTIASLLIIVALSLTASRAAMLTAAVVLAALTAYGLARRTPGRWQAPIVLAVLCLLAGGNALVGSVSGVRLKFWNDDVWYRSTIVPVNPSPSPLPATLAPGEEVQLDVDVRNAGARPWPAAGPKPIALSYHWYDDATGQLAVYDGIRTWLPQDVPAGATVRLRATVRAPDKPGRHRLHLEMVHEYTTWFGDQGDAGLDASVQVGPSRGLPPALPPAPTPGAAAVVPPTPAAAAVVPPARAAPLDRASRSMLWRAAVRAWREHPLLGLGPDNFRRAYHRYIGVRDPDVRLHANNLYLETLASLGLAGVAALLLIVVGLGRAARIAVGVHGAASVAGLLVVGVATGLGAYLVHGFFDYFLEFTPTYALFWMLGGIVTGLAGNQVKAAR